MQKLHTDLSGDVIGIAQNKRAFLQRRKSTLFQLSHFCFQVIAKAAAKKILRGKKRHFLFIEMLQGDAVFIGVESGNGQVNVSFQQILLQPAVGVFFQNDLDAGMLQPKGMDDIGHDGSASGGGDANAQHALLVCADIVKILFQIFHLLQNFTCILEKFCPGVGQLQRCVPDEKRASQLCFQGGNAGT